MKRSATPLQPRIRRFTALISAASVLVILLAACGGGDGDSSPTPTVLPTTAATAPIASPQPGQITVGDLSDQITAAWPLVSTITQTTATIVESATPEASPAASADPVLVTEVDAAGNKRITVSAVGLVLSELISIRGQIWALGYQVWSIPDTAVGPAFGDGWVEVDTTSIDGNASFNDLILRLLSPYPVIYGNLDATARARVVEPLGARVEDGRTCSAYRIPATTETGQAYDTIISLDESGLPCSIETVGLGQSQLNTYVFNAPIDITAPPTTPSASPAAGN